MKFSAEDNVKAELVKLRYFAGLSDEGWIPNVRIELEGSRGQVLSLKDA